MWPSVGHLLLNTDWIFSTLIREHFYIFAELQILCPHSHTECSKLQIILWEDKLEIRMMEIKSISPATNLMEAQEQTYLFAEPFKWMI